MLLIYSTYPIITRKRKNENENERPVISTAETAAIEGNDGPSPSTDSGSQV